MNSDMVKPKIFGHLHLVYHFTIPLSDHEGQKIHPKIHFWPFFDFFTPRFVLKSNSKILNLKIT